MNDLLPDILRQRDGSACSTKGEVTIYQPCQISPLTC
nr:MAG TPA: hypothetical protein [Caudoviricetes sp.]